jgi:hypothetical protein
MAAQYSYIGLAGEVIELADSNINFRDIWSGTTSYAVLDAVIHNNRYFICIAANTGVTPPDLFTVETPTYWSPLVLVSGMSPANATDAQLAAASATSIATTALNTAWTGTQAAADAYSLATTALNTAWTGTQAAADAYSLATQALDTAWAGTSAAAAARFGVQKIWAGRLVQSGSSAPVATVYANTFVGNIVWYYISTGVYEGVLTPNLGEFTSGYTGINTSPYYVSADGTMSIPASEIIDTGTIRVSSWETTNGNNPLVLSDNRLNTYMEIKTY